MPMNDVLKIVKKIIILFLLVYIPLELFYWLNPYQKREKELSYNATIIEKHQRLRSLPSPKIVLVAGSSMAYGMNSEMIEKATHKNVVNMAIHFDYGTKFMLNQLKDEMKAGDWVVMGFEYMIESEGNSYEKYVLTQFYPEAKKWYNYYSFPDFLVSTIKLRISSLRINSVKLWNKTVDNPTIDDTTSIFFRKSINQYGDLVAHLNNTPMKEIPLSSLSQFTDLTDCIQDMNDFTTAMQQKGVKVVYAFPPYAQSSYIKDKELLQKIASDFQTKATFQILGQPETFVYPDSLFQDSPYHLNKTGRELHTQRLLNQLLRLH